MFLQPISVTFQLIRQSVKHCFPRCINQSGTNSETRRPTPNKNTNRHIVKRKGTEHSFAEWKAKQKDNKRIQSEQHLIQIICESKQNIPKTVKVHALSLENV